MNRIAIFLFGLLLAFAPSAMAQVNAPAPYATTFSSTAKAIKASRGILQWLACYNPNATPVYIQFFDATAATPGTTAPKLFFALTATSSTPFPVSAQFLTGIMAAATTTATGSSAPGTAVPCNVGFN